MEEEAVTPQPMREKALLPVVNGGPALPRPIRLVATEKALQVRMPSARGRDADLRVIPIKGRSLPCPRARNNLRKADPRVIQTDRVVAKTTPPKVREPRVIPTLKDQLQKRRMLEHHRKARCQWSKDNG